MIDIPNDKKLNDIVIYSKGSRGDIEQCGIWVDASQYNLYDYSQSLSPIDESDCDIKSDGNNILKISKESLTDKDNMFLMIRITSQNMQKVKTYLSYNSYITSMKFFSNEEVLFCGKKNESKTITINYGTDKNKMFTLTQIDNNPVTVEYDGKKKLIENTLNLYFDKDISQLTFNNEENDYCFLMQIKEKEIPYLQLTEGNNQLSISEIDFFEYYLYYPIDTAKPKATIILDLSDNALMKVKSTSLVSENAPFTTSPKTEFVNYYVESTNSSIIINVNGIKEDLNVIMIKLESTEYGKPLEIKATCYSNYLTLPMYEYIYGKVSTIDPIQTFKIEKYQSKKMYAIEIDFEPNKNNEFINYSIEYSKKELLYANETEIEISSKKVNGKRFIIAKNVGVDNYFVITLIKESTDNKENKFMIKYKTIKDESELEKDIIMESFSVHHDRSINSIKVINSFLKVKKLLYVKYHILAYSSQQVSPDSLDSVYFKDSTYALSYISHNLTLKDSSSLYKMIVKATEEEYKDISFILIVEYKKEKAEEINLIALPPKQSFADSKVTIPEASQITYGISDNIYNLTRSSVEDRYLLIYLVEGPVINSNSYIYITTSGDGTNDTDLYLENSTYFDYKREIVYKINNNKTNFLLTFSSSTNEIIEYFFNYTFTNTIPKHTRYKFLPYLTAKKYIDFIRVSFREIFEQIPKEFSRGNYLYRVYRRNAFDKLSTINSIYPKSSHSFINEYEPASYYGRLNEIDIPFENVTFNLNEEYYIVIIGEFFLKESDIPVYIFYQSELIETKNVYYNRLEPNQDYSMNLTYSNSFLLRQANEKITYYLFEFGYKTNTKYVMSFSYEKYKEKPRQKNDKTIKIKIYYHKTLSGKQVIAFNTSEPDLIITFINSNYIRGKINFHYYVSSNKISPHEYIMEDFTSNRKGKAMSFSFTKPNITNYSQIDLSLLIYTKIDVIANLDTINSNSPELIEKKEKIAYEEKNSSFVFDYTLGENYGIICATVVLTIKYNEGMVLHYGFSDNCNNSEFNYPVLRDKKINYITLNNETQVSYIIQKNDLRYSYLGLEFNTNNNIDFTIEVYKSEQPQYENDTSLTWVRNKEINGRKCIFYENKNEIETDFIVTFYKKETNENESTTFIVKYKTIEDVGEYLNKEYPIDIYEKKLYSSSFFDSITIQFNKFGHENYSSIYSVTYYLYVYNVSDIKDPNSLNVLYLKEKPKFIVKGFNITLGKDGEVTYTDSNKEIYVTLIASFSLRLNQNEFEEYLINYGVVKNTSKTYILFVVLFIVLVVISLIIGIIIYCKKKKKVNVESDFLLEKKSSVIN